MERVAQDLVLREIGVGVGVPQFRLFLQESYLRLNLNKLVFKEVYNEFHLLKREI